MALNDSNVGNTMPTKKASILQAKAAVVREGQARSGGRWRRYQRGGYMADPRLPGASSGKARPPHLQITAGQRREAPEAQRDMPSG